ncbi:MAG TPA: hypothetical protein VFN75_08655, partial [Pseudonocardiaceae bacterium]|nr:hypothetical protein [Pseudonocardiaceae bacterium]
RKVLTLPVVLTEHVFDKIRSIDMALAEFEQLLGSGDVIEEHEVEAGRLKELVLVIDWKRPLHVVMIVDAVRGEERILTVYEPDPERWSHDYRRRRR